jgi:hypothetical protein
MIAQFDAATLVMSCTLATCVWLQLAARASSNGVWTACGLFFYSFV